MIALEPLYSLFTLDWEQVVSHLVLLTIAYLLAVPIGWDREVESRGMGLRTFPLVAVGSCGFLLLSTEVLPGSEAQARVLYGLITGIGFIGGGAILKRDNRVSGTATAAAIWTTGAIGAAVAYRRYEIALVLSMMTFATLRFMLPLKSVARNGGSRDAD